MEPSVGKYQELLRWCEWEEDFGEGKIREVCQLLQLGASPDCRRGQEVGIPVALYPGATAGGQRISGTLGRDFRGFKIMTPRVMWWFLGLYGNGIYERPWRSRVTTKFRLQDSSKVWVKKEHIRLSSWKPRRTKGQLEGDWVCQGWKLLGSAEYLAGLRSP